MSDLSERVAALGITCEPVYLGLREEEWKHFAWQVTLKHDGKQYVCSYSTGIGHILMPRGVRREREGLYIPSHDVFVSEIEAIRKEWVRPKRPEVADVVACLVSDASSTNETFHEWCGSFGYDTDSVKAREMYFTCQAIRDALMKLLGPALLSELASLEH